MNETQKIILKIKRSFNDFNPSHPEVLDDFYDPKAVFMDPVVKVEGLKNIRKYYAHVYKNVKSIAFEFGEITGDGSTFFAPWTMTLKVSGLNLSKPYEVEGGSLLKFNSKGQVVYHRDYVDLGAMVYEKIPVVGQGIRLLKGFLKHNS